MTTKTALYLLLAIIGILVCILFYLINKYRKDTIVPGKINSEDIVYLKLASNVYKDFNDKQPECMLAHYFSKDLELTSDIIVPLRHYAVSYNDRFCIHINGEDRWVDPGDNFTYDVSAKPTKVKASKSSTTTATSKKSKTSNSQTAANKKISTSPEDGLTGK